MHKPCLLYLVIIQWASVLIPYVNFVNSAAVFTHEDTDNTLVCRFHLISFAWADMAGSYGTSVFRCPRNVGISTGRARFQVTWCRSDGVLCEDALEAVMVNLSI